jgi:hypothetical protein
VNQRIENFKECCKNYTWIKKKLAKSREKERLQRNSEIFNDILNSVKATEDLINDTTVQPNSKSNSNTKTNSNTNSNKVAMEEECYETDPTTKIFNSITALTSCSVSEDTASDSELLEQTFLLDNSEEDEEVQSDGELLHRSVDTSSSNEFQAAEEEEDEDNAFISVDENASSERETDEPAELIDNKSADVVNKEIMKEHSIDTMNDKHTEESIDNSMHEQSETVQNIHHKQVRPTLSDITTMNITPLELKLTDETPIDAVSFQHSAEQSQSEGESMSEEEFVNNNSDKEDICDSSFVISHIPLLSKYKKVSIKRSDKDRIQEIPNDEMNHILLSINDRCSISTYYSSISQ